MATTTSDACINRLSVQVQELARILELYNDLENLYHNKIGTLYDEFNIEMPLRFGKDYNWLWNDETIEGVKAASGVAAGVLNEVRLQPKPYEPKGSAEVKEQLTEVQKLMLKDMADDFIECACPTFCRTAEW